MIKEKLLRKRIYKESLIDINSYILLTLGCVNFTLILHM